MLYMPAALVGRDRRAVWLGRKTDGQTCRMDTGAWHAKRRRTETTHRSEPHQRVHDFPRLRQKITTTPVNPPFWEAAPGISALHHQIRQKNKHKITLPVSPLDPQTNPPPTHLFLGRPSKPVHYCCSLNT